MSDLLDMTPSGWPWAVALAVGFPLLLLLAGEISARLARSGHALAGSVRSARNWLLPAVAIVLFLRQVLDLPGTNLWSRLAITALWVLLVAFALGIANALLFESATLGSWQRRVPRLLRDLVRALLVAVAAAIVYSSVWDKDLSGALAALGVTSIVVGLALQEPLGNLFSGVMLLMERPFEVGDDIEVAGTTGVVKEINWRSVHVQSFGGIRRVVPNSTLNKETITNYSRPKPQRMEIVEVSFSYDDPPNKVRAALLEAALETPGILHDPQPISATWAYADSSVTYRIIYRTQEEDRWPARNELMTRLWYVAKRHGLTMPYPISVNLEYKHEGPFAKPGPGPDELLKRFPRIPAIGTDETGESVRVLSFGRGEIVFAAGEELDGVYLVASGAVSLQSGDGAESVEIAVVGPGEFFGEAGLYGRQASDMRAAALEDSSVLVIAPDTVRRMFENSPALARDAGGRMDVRRRAAHTARTAAARAVAAAAERAPDQRS